MSAIHRQLPQYAFSSVKRVDSAKSGKRQAQPTTAAAAQQQQAQRADSEPAAVPGYN